MKKLSAICLFLIGSLVSVAQTVEYTNIKRINSAGIGAIKKVDELSGYYTLYREDSKDSKVQKIRVEMADLNLNAVTSFTVTRDNRSYFIENVFNGEEFVFSFYDAKRKVVDYEIYSKEGKKLGVASTDEMNLTERARLDQLIQASQTNDDVRNVSIYPVGTDAFVRTDILKNKKAGYQIVAFSDNGKVLWKNGSEEVTKEHEFCDILYVDDNFIVASIMRKSSLMSKDLSSYITLIDAKTGETRFENELKGTGKSELLMLNCFVEAELGTLTLIGEVYAPGDEPFKNQSAGLYIQEIDLDGNEKSLNTYLWEKEIKRVKNENMTPEQKESEKKSSLFVHKIVRTSDGTMTLIGEQYKKSVSALGVAGKAMGAGTSAAEIVIMNMVVIQFNKAKEITNYNIVDKKLRRITLPSGYGLASSAVLAQVMNIYGYFDYSFTSKQSGSDNFTVVYTDKDRKEAGSKTKNDLMLGVLQFNGAKFEASRVPINSDATYFWIRNAKTGYAYVAEYFKKTKSLKCRLESLKN